MNEPRKLVMMAGTYNLECDEVWHYIVPNDGGMVLTEGMCDCDEQPR